MFLFFFFSPVCFCPRRRIDVSPSAFKKHARVFEEMEESDYKVTKRFQNLKFQPSLCASWKSNVLSPPSPTPPSPFKGGAIILNTQDPEYLSYTRYALLLRPPSPPAAFLIWLLGGYVHAQTKRLIKMEVTIEMVLSKPFSGHLNKSHSKYFLLGSAFEHVGLCTNHHGGSMEHAAFPWDLCTVMLLPFLLKGGRGGALFQSCRVHTLCSLSQSVFLFCFLVPFLF